MVNVNIFETVYKYDSVRAVMRKSRRSKEERRFQLSFLICWVSQSHFILSYIDIESKCLIINAVEYCHL